MWSGYVQFACIIIKWGEASFHDFKMMFAVYRSRAVGAALSERDIERAAPEGGLSENIRSLSVLTKTLTKTAQRRTSVVPLDTEEGPDLGQGGDGERKLAGGDQASALDLPRRLASSGPYDLVISSHSQERFYHRDQNQYFFNRMLARDKPPVVVGSDREFSDEWQPLGAVKRREEDVEVTAGGSVVLRRSGWNELKYGRWGIARPESEAVRDAQILDESVAAATDAPAVLKENSTPRPALQSRSPPAVKESSSSSTKQESSPQKANQAVQEVLTTSSPPFNEDVKNLKRAPKTARPIGELEPVGELDLLPFERQRDKVTEYYLGAYGYLMYEVMVSVLLLLLLHIVIWGPLLSGYNWRDLYTGFTSTIRRFVLARLPAELAKFLSDSDIVLVVSNKSPPQQHATPSTSPVVLPVSRRGPRTGARAGGWELVSPAEGGGRGEGGRAAEDWEELEDVSLSSPEDVPAGEREQLRSVAGTSRAPPPQGQKGVGGVLENEGAISKLARRGKIFLIRAFILLFEVTLLEAFLITNFDLDFGIRFVPAPRIVRSRKLWDGSGPPRESSARPTGGLPSDGEIARIMGEASPQKGATSLGGLGRRRLTESAADKVEDKIHPAVKIRHRPPQKLRSAPQIAELRAKARAKAGQKSGSFAEKGSLVSAPDVADFDNNHKWVHSKQEDHAAGGAAETNAKEEPSSSEEAGVVSASEQGGDLVSSLTKKDLAKLNFLRTMSVYSGWPEARTDPRLEQSFRAAGFEAVVDPGAENFSGVAHKRRSSPKSSSGFADLNELPSYKRPKVNLAVALNGFSVFELQIFFEHANMFFPIPDGPVSVAFIIEARGVLLDMMQGWLGAGGGAAADEDRPVRPGFESAASLEMTEFYRLKQLLARQGCKILKNKTMVQSKGCYVFFLDPTAEGSFSKSIREQPRGSGEQGDATHNADDPSLGVSEAEVKHTVGVVDRHFAHRRGRPEDPRADSGERDHTDVLLLYTSVLEWNPQYYVELNPAIYFRHVLAENKAGTRDNFFYEQSTGGV